MPVADCNAQLRSQQLNSDGTPKRPMNAFMIFARKRRPMVIQLHLSLVASTNHEVLKGFLRTTDHANWRDLKNSKQGMV